VEKKMSGLLSRSELLVLTSEIVAAYVANHTVAVDELPALIQQAFQALAVTDSEHYHATMRPTPAISINKSVTDDYIVCLEDGRKLKVLKRHLRTAYNMTVEQYKERWGLPADYPAVALNYAKHRSHIALTTGLGTKKAPRKITIIDEKKEKSA
jgi:predicted transcriptional regulator